MLNPIPMTRVLLGREAEPRVSAQRFRRSGRETEISDRFQTIVPVMCPSARFDQIWAVNM